MEIPILQSCENNKEPLYNELKSFISPNKELLEIGSYTGQHAEYLSEKLKLSWQTSDMPENLAPLIYKFEQLNSLSLPPKHFQVVESKIEHNINNTFDYILTINTIHIMSDTEVKTFCHKIHEFCKKDGYLFIYGAFKFDGEFTTQSNAEFDLWIKSKFPKGGVKNFEDVRSMLNGKNWNFKEFIKMPANNYLLVFNR